MLCAIPIETAPRELDGVLYLALHLAKRSIPSLIGERMVNRLVASYPKPVIYFDGDHDLDFDRKIIEKGGAVVNMHPEGLNMFDAPSILNSFTESVGTASAMCLWGEAQADLVTAGVGKQDKNKVLATGYPAFDLASPRFLEYYQDQYIVDNYGQDYILINTNFSYGNNSMGLDRWLDTVSQAENLSYFQQEQHRKFVYDLAQYHIQLMHAFVEMAKGLSEVFPSRKIIVRPHPSENVDFYTKALSDCSNIVISNQGTVRSWLATAGTVIHHDCTTGVEALLMDKHVISYRPVFDDERASPIPSLVGIQAETFEQLVELVHIGTTSTELVCENQQAIAPYFASIEANASQKIAELAVQLGGGAVTLPQPPSVRQKFDNWTKFAGRVLKTHLPAGICENKRRKAQTALGKFPKVSRKKIIVLLDKLRAIEPDLPKVDVQELCLNTFLIEKHSSS